jgi:hypothetical protein
VLALKSLRLGMYVGPFGVGRRFTPVRLGRALGGRAGGSTLGLCLSDERLLLTLAGALGALTLARLLFLRVLPVHRY